MAEQVRPARRSWMPLVLLLLGLVVAGVLLFAGWYPRHQERKNVERESKDLTTEAPKVVVAKVQRAKSAAELAVPGTSLPYTEASIYARASGYVTRRLVDIGDNVRAGQLLAVIDAPDLDKQVVQAQSTLDQSRSALLQVQAQLHLSDLTWQRYKVLVAKGVFSRQDGDQQEANYRVAEANVKAAENTVSANEANLNRLVVLQEFERVRAPFTGVITARNIDVGTLITSAGSGLGQGSTPTLGLGLSGQGNNQGASGNLTSNVSPSTGGAGGGQMFTLAEIDRLRVLVSVPEIYRRDIHTGQRARLEFDDRRLGTAAHQVQGLVTRTSASIDQNTRTLLVEVQVRNLFHLVPGMYVVVHFIDAARDLPLIVPGSAIVIRNGKPAVALITDNVAHMRQVNIGRDFGDQVEIAEGLEQGDVIAVNVTDEVSDGGKVEPQFPATQPPAAGQKSAAAGEQKTQPTSAGQEK